MSTSSYHHSATFLGGSCQITSTPSIPHSTTFVEVRVKSSLHHLFLTPQLSWRYVSNQVCTIQSSLHNFRGGTCQIKPTPSIPHSTTFVEVRVKSSLHHLFLTPQLSWRYESNQACTIYSSLHIFRGGTSQIKSAPSIPHSTSFVEVRVKSSLHHLFLTPHLSWRYESNQVCTIQSSLHNFRGGTCQVRSAPSSPHSTTFVEVRVKSSLHHPVLTPQLSWK